MATIKIIDSGLEKYSVKSDTNVLGRMYDNNAEAVDIIIPKTETESVCYANVMSCDGEVIDRIKIENNSLPISSNLTQYCEIYIGFSFIRTDGTEKQSEQLKFGFLYAIKPKDFTPEQPDTEKALAKLIASGFVKLIQDGDTVKFYNWQDIVVGTIYHEGINGFEIVDELPTENIDTHTIYLVKETVGEADDYYNEYIYINGEWELLGSTRIDLSDYYTKEQVNKIIETLTGVFNEKVDIINVNIDKKFDKAGGTVTGDMVVGGNFTVQGKTTTVDSETLRVTDKLIEVGKGNTAPLTSPAGLITPKYDGTNNGGIVYDHTGTAYVGDITLDSNGNVDVNNSDLQAIATRDTTITDGNIVEWDNTNKTLVDSGKAIDDLSTATNLENGEGTGSIQQKGITYDKLITDYEPNMAAWVIAKNGGAVPTDVPTYLTVLQNSIVPTSNQVVNILNNHKNDVNTVITNFRTLPSPYENYGIDNLIAGALAGYGLTPSSDLSNIVGKVGSAAAILGVMNKAFSPGAFAGGVGCEAGDEGYPGDTICSFAYGGYVKTKAICSIGVGLNLLNSGNFSAVFGIGNKEYKIEGSETEKADQRWYLDNLAEAGGTVTGTGDDRVGVTGINKGFNNFMAGNSHYIGEGAHNTVVGNQNVIDGYNNSIVGGLINFIRAENSTILGGSKNRIDGGFGNLLNGSRNSHLYSRNCLSSGNRTEINQGDCILNSGYENKILREIYSGAIGHGLKLSDGKERFAVGAFNIDNPKAALMVGNGTSDTDDGRKNAFEVLKDGRAKVQTAPQDNDDVARKLELDNVTARYVSTSILGG